MKRPLHQSWSRFSQRAESLREGGKGRIARFVVLHILLARRVILVGPTGFPPHPPLSRQHKKRVGGEGANCGNTDPGRREGFLPLACPGLQSAALLYGL